MENSLILVVNCGSSSLKFALMPENGGTDPILSGLAECLGQSDSCITYKTEDGDKQKDMLNSGDHAVALDALIKFVEKKGWLSRISAVGHRLVHGAEKFNSSVLITDAVIKAVEECVPLAPLHNPANLLGVRVAQKLLPSLPQVGVFDTAFHQTMPKEAFLYAIPMSYYRDYGVRRYGFHGTSHQYVAMEAVSMLGLDPNNHGLVIAHLGNGASATAVKNGKSVDTTMGLTPLEGLVMGTRSGDIDPGALFYIANRAGKTMADLDNILNKESGLLGLSELSNDCRALEDAADKGHEGAILALDVFAHRLARLAAGLAMSLDRFDAIVFTGGIGENSSTLRKATLDRMKPFGFELYDTANDAMFRGKSGIISKVGSKGPKALVICTNEELMIARDTARLAKSK